MATKHTIIVKVTPNAKDNSIKEERDLFDNITYKIKTVAMPQDGAANKLVIEIIAKHFKIAKKNIKIIRGLTSRDKIIEIEQSS